jgi:anaerobic selenocysteine-containing dehydrogenase/Fe-S-cluster-containing dehydrogenase component
MAQEVSRRSFLKLAAATGAAVAVPGCKPAARHLVPYVVPDENVTPGLPSFYATTCAECPAGCGVVARVREGRVTKLEGNPIDPIGAGALCARGQAALQELYNPDRLPAPRRRETDGRGTPLNWRNALREFNAQLKAAAAAGKDRVLFIGQPQGPTLRKITEAWLKTYNSQRFVAFEAINYQALTEAAQRCFNRQDRPVYQLDRAEVIVSFGADFLETYLSPVEYTRQFAAFRAPRKAGEQTTMGLALYVGPRMNLTAANSDQWFACRAGNEGAVALAVLRAVVDSGALHPQSGLDANALRQFTAGYEPEAVARRSGVPVSVIQAIAQRFTKARSAVALAAADDLAGQMGAMLLNTATGNLGNTMRFIDAPNLTWASSRGEIADAVKAMHDGAVDVLVVAAVNPVFTLPPELSTAQAMRRVKLVVWAGWVPDETAEFAHLLLPIDHPLESWDDASPLPGVARLRQPVTRRVFDSRALGDLMLDSIAQAGVNPPPVAWKDTQEALKATWHEIQTQVAPNTSFDDFWAKALSEGGVFTELKTASLTISPNALGEAPKPDAPGGESLALASFPHIFLYDGRGADKPWLQEVPEPVAQIVWDNWAEIHPDTAKRLNVEEGQVVEIVSRHGRLTVAAHLSPRLHPEAIAIPIGQGHLAYGRYASGRGANPWQVLPADRLVTAVEVRATEKRVKLVSPLAPPGMLEQQLVKSLSLDELRRGVVPQEEEPYPEPWEMYDPYTYPKHEWGMTIDLNACTGCSACVAACYAENNVPVVGKELIAQGRIMSWIRIERYWPQTPQAPLMLKMPMLCQQCAHAPCEPVCPVFASYRTEEGLNGQVYNRCVGTRYCSNNCPYKVRRFNWYKPEWPHPLQLQLNPDVSIRGAGVMEKCTFCIQRIRFAEMQALTGQQPLVDGTVVPACAQACPAQAITFGDMKDANSAMMKRRKLNELRNYRPLNDDLNTQPGIVYLRGIYREHGEV